jgi:DNA modification methylase
MKIELRATTSIIPYERNPRKNDAAVDAVARSIQEFGFRQPIVVDRSGVIVVGHTRWKAATKLGLARVPVHVAKDLTPQQARAYRIADNRLNEIADWETELLTAELSELKLADVDLALLGFSEDDLARLLATEVKDGLCDPDEVPKPPEKAITKPGDLWSLGNHRLLCGDAGNATDVDRLLDGVKVQLINTDPPYNVRLEPRSNNAIAAGLSTFAPAKRGRRSKSLDRAGRHHSGMDLARNPRKAKPTHRRLRAKDRPLENDFVSDAEFGRLVDAWFANMARVLKPGRAFYIWGGYSNIANYPPALAANGLYFSQAIIWHKQHPVLTRKDFMGDHEWAFYGWREGAAHRFYGPKNVPDVWSIKKISPNAMVHLTEKPVELAIRAMTFSSRPGETVLDLFGGSGSTLIAAEQTERRAFVMELDPLYCDVIVQRWEKFAGRTAERG